MQAGFRFSTLAAGFAVSVLLTLSAASQADHAWANYHWARTANPFTLRAGDNVSATWDGHLATANAEWSASSVLQLEPIDGGTKPKNCRPTDGRIEVCSNRYGWNGWLGVAQIWVSGEHITQGTAKVNDTYFQTATYDDPDWRQLVICQEIAHVFGLGHQDEDFDNPNLGSCMDYTSTPVSADGDNTRPDAHDFEQLELIYADLDSFNSYDDAPLDGGDDSGGGGKGRGGRGKPGSPPGQVATPGQDVDLADPGAWGRIVASSSNGRITVHELDLGGGNRIISVVIWA